MASPRGAQGFGTATVVGAVVGAASFQFLLYFAAALFSGIPVADPLAPLAGMLSFAIGVLLFVPPLAWLVGAVVGGILGAILPASVGRFLLCVAVALLVAIFVPNIARRQLGMAMPNTGPWLLWVPLCLAAGAVVGTWWARRTRRDDALAHDAT